jgi:hypothetical protein
VAKQATPVRTFHPSGTSLVEATPLELGVAELTTGADILVKEHATYAVRGKMTGNPTAFAGMTLTPEDEASLSLSISSSNIKPTGEFEFMNVPPGRYTLTYLGRMGEGSSLVNTTVTVTADVNDLSVPVTALISVHGQIRLSPVTLNFDLSQAKVELEAADVLIGPSFSAPVRSDGTFVIGNCNPGHYFVRVKTPQGR